MGTTLLTGFVNVLLVYVLRIYNTKSRTRIEKCRRPSAKNTALLQGVDIPFPPLSSSTHSEDEGGEQDSSAIVAAA